MKYVMTEAVAPEGMALLDQSEKVYVAHDANPANYTEEMKDADALIVRAAPAKIVNKAVMEAAPRLKVIGRTGVGYDSVDVDAATELGIPVVMAINMMDLVQKSGNKIHIDKQPCCCRAFPDTDAGSFQKPC